MLGLLAFAMAAAQPALPMVFGLQLGAPVSLPECQKPSYSSVYPMNQPVTCQGLPGKAAPSQPEMGYVIFPVSALPTIVGLTLATTTVLDGKLEAFSAATLSHNVSHDIMEQLSAKFGKPSISDPETAEVDKIAIPSTWARWDRPGYRVEYHAISGEIDYGSLLIETDKARSFREAKERAANAQRTPL